MPAAISKSEIMSLLRESVADVRPRQVPPLPFGISEIDERLTDRGLDGAALHEVASAAFSLSNDAAAALFGIAACFATSRSPRAVGDKLTTPGDNRGAAADNRRKFIDTGKNESRSETGDISVAGSGKDCPSDTLRLRPIEPVGQSSLLQIVADSRDELRTAAASLTSGVPICSEIRSRPPTSCRAMH